MFRGVRIRRSARLSLGAATLATVSACPALAWACPACAGVGARNAMFLKVGSLFVLLPFLVVAVVLYVLRQAPESTS